MSHLVGLTVGVPLLAAALLAIGGSFVGRRVADTVALASAVAVAVMCLLLVAHVGTGLDVYWFGGWALRSGFPIGIDFGIDALGGSLAGFVAVLMALAMVFTWRFLDADPPYFQVLMLVFLTGMVGLALSGDLFNMFVFFELMSVSAFALVGYKIDERASLEGSLNFAVVNTLGSFLLLLGIGLIYAKTGTLNLAQMGHALDQGAFDGTVIASFALRVSGFLIKAGVVPFHFWLSDAYAVAPTPVCLVLAGAMSEVGLFAMGRIYFTVFETPFVHHHHATLQAIFVGFGLLTALLGSAMALVQDHLKRLLAFAVVSYVGVFLVGLGLLDTEGVAGTAVYVLADGFVKASLFACVGIVQHRLGHVSQRRLHGRCRQLPWTGAVFVAGGLAIAALPPFGPFLGKSMIEEATMKAGFGFAPALIVLTSILTGAAILRAAGRVFMGWGPDSRQPDPADAESHPEAREGTDHTPAVMFVPAVLLLVAGMGVGVWFGFADLATRGAARFAGHAAYVRDVLGGGASGAVPAPSSSAPRWFDWLFCGGSTAGAVALAAFLLNQHRLGGAWARAVERAATAVIKPVARLHSGHIGDYAAWLLVGLGAFGGLFTLTMR